MMFRDRIQDYKVPEVGEFCRNNKLSRNKLSSKVFWSKVSVIAGAAVTTGVISVISERPFMRETREFACIFSLSVGLGVGLTYSMDNYNRLKGGLVEKYKQKPEKEIIFDEKHLKLLPDHLLSHTLLFIDQELSKTACVSRRFKETSGQMETYVASGLQRTFLVEEGFVDKNGNIDVNKTIEETSIFGRKDVCSIQVANKLKKPETIKKRIILGLFELGFDLNKVINNSRGVLNYFDIGNVLAYYGEFDQARDIAYRLIEMGQFNDGLRSIGNGIVLANNGGFDQARDIAYRLIERGQFYELRSIVNELANNGAFDQARDIVYHLINRGEFWNALDICKALANNGASDQAHDSTMLMLNVMVISLVVFCLCYYEWGEFSGQEV